MAAETPKPRIKPDLRRYHVEGWLHTVAYRVAIAYSLLASIAIVLYLIGLLEWLYLKATLAVYWVILTPLFYFVVKGTLLALSKGVISSSLAETALELLREKYRYRYVALTAAFYILLLAWIAGFILFIVRG